MTRTVTAAVLAGLACAVLAGCSNEPVPEPQPSAGVLIPGKPGESATAVPPGEAARHQQNVTLSEADVTYVTNMIPHHRQALVMTALVAERASDERVRGVAGRIDAAQGGEIAMMSGWLTEHGKPVPPEDTGGHAGHGSHGGHDHATMPGMATPEQLEALRAAKGTDFDRLFLELMIRHHEGALTMAEQQLASGVNDRAQEMAQEVITGQTAEIERMRAIQLP
ncbi:DUF305 domain-containing protein [Amycolatopsis magusensis]|uniref:Uncharacterized protein (DUF305 family) n=1 Tax=Amycolatopsis magusensis TaxID=882444 RepID=A0ABS4PPN7_9PSEU|nr:DUF305 domain-containing protein [Amycolatopsis magusensis]MBP2181398.1 uncharacterized protein (DUF305 family) [Amycolatopsis magusensis]